LNRFDITAYHRPGHLNVIADYYSRAPMKGDWVVLNKNLC